MAFPKDFVWGAAAASYQIEGASRAGGKGPSVWDAFCAWPGRVWEGNTGDVSCDHYHRYREDVALMAELGLKAYRFSISWPRVMPDGDGRVNRKGLDFYDRLTDALLERGIQPWLTLFHWDYPLTLFRRGRWLSTDSPDWLAQYAQVIVDRLSDRVAHWMTLNEPQVFIDAGHRTGRHAPGLELALPDVLLAAHHTLLAHGKAVQVIRGRAKARPSVGAAVVGTVSYPASNRPPDIEAARKRMFSVSSRDVSGNTWFADPMLLGRYPEDGLALFGRDMPAVPPGDMETICQPLDFYGVNIYRGDAVRAVRDSFELELGTDGPPLTTMDWRVTPEALYWGPRFLYERYKLPIVITENGMAGCDWVQLDGKVHDPARIDFLARYLGALRRAIGDGVKVDGYFAWSIMDNFEWAQGYKQRFGLVYVDYATGRRIPKDSAFWYRDVIASNGGALS